MKKGIILILFFLTAALHSHDAKWEVFKAKILPELEFIEGRCSLEKAHKMMDLIYAVRPQICVEIGVFSGSSIYPTACALTYLKTGVVYAIDPWTCSGNERDDWRHDVDLEKIHSNFNKMLKKHKLHKHCYVMRMTSVQACDYFLDESIDILHINGNHTTAHLDIMLYFPKVKCGGYIWIDDVDWRSTTRSIDFLSNYCDEIPEMFEGNCILFRKR